MTEGNDLPAERFEAQLLHRLAVARGDVPADLVLANGRVLNVFTGEIIDADVALAGEYIAGIAAPGAYRGNERVDLAGRYVAPGFIDAHMHLESSKLMVDAFSEAVLPTGTTSVVADPHEIANVFGMPGIHALFSAAEAVPLDYFLMVSSCVPASPFESSGSTLDASDVAEMLAGERRAIGVAELMDFPGVVAGRPGPVSKLVAARLAGRHVDGHAPGLSGLPLNAYVAAGIRSDHECTTYEEALEKRRLGVWIMIREGSAAHNLEALLPIVLRYGTTNMMLCTDDREPDELLESGHMNAVVRKAVALGCLPADAIVMATLHTARYHGLQEHGAVAPGYLADLLVLPDFIEFRPSAVYKRGRLVAADGHALEAPRVEAPAWMRASVHIPALDAAAFRIPATSDRVRVIEVNPGQLVTRSRTETPTVRDGEIVADPARDLLKAAVIERHHGTGRVGLGLVTGFGLRGGALASTIAHDAHNVVVVGTDDRDMAVAVSRLAEIGGGQVAVAGGKVLDEVPCPLGGLLSDRPAAEVAAEVRRLKTTVSELGARLPAPFMAMSFLALSVIPELKLTDHGLVDTINFELVPLAAP